MPLSVLPPTASQITRLTGSGQCVNSLETTSPWSTPGALLAGKSVADQHKHSMSPSRPILRHGYPDTPPRDVRLERL